MTATLKQLPIHSLHVEAGGHFGHFGDWEVPLYFSSILEEHEAVRKRAGLFDISHMGELYLSGRDAKGFLDYLLPRKMSRLEDGKALYSPLLNAGGGMVDDVILYQFDPENFLLIVNASNIQKDFDWIHRDLPATVELKNASDQKSLFALQGPESKFIIESLFHCDFRSLGYYRFLKLNSEWGELFISRTGYTGEDGFEIMAEVSGASSLWIALMKAGNPWGIRPVGFGARDTLRLEASMPLYGQDMDDSTSIIEAGLEWAIDWDKDNFIGRERNFREKKEGPRRKLAGFEMLDRGIPRQGYAILKSGKPIGEVTSGSFAPALKKNIGLGYVPFGQSEVGNEIEILVRDKSLKAKVIKMPFYKRKK